MNWKQIASIFFSVMVCIAISFFSPGGNILAAIQVGEEVNQHFETEHPYSGMGIIWEHTFHWPKATYISIHFAWLDLAPGDYVEISSPDSLHSVTYGSEGKVIGDEETPLREFWAQYIPGDTALVTLVSNSHEGSWGFAIDRWAYGYDESFFDEELEAICSGDGKQWAPCFGGTVMYNRSRAVARLLINGTRACTGWLFGSQGHIITNNHCIGNQIEAQNTVYEFMAEGNTCNVNCNTWFACPGIIAAGGGVLVDTDSNLDYSLILLPNNPTPIHGFLQARGTPAVLGETIYIPQHPRGQGKQIADFDDTVPPGPCRVDSTTEPPCTGGSADIGYFCDTEGGSSGSPVIATADNLVVALHHCARCPNRGVPIGDIITALGQNQNLPANAIGTDLDGDGIPDLVDNCPSLANPSQSDLDGDSIGDLCDDDDDDDGLLDVYETNTGKFISETNTGTDPFDPDTDNDSMTDGDEVVSGRNPVVNEPALIATVSMLLLLD